MDSHRYETTIARFYSSGEWRIFHKTCTFHWPNFPACSPHDRWRIEPLEIDSSGREWRADRGGRGREETGRVSEMVGRRRKVFLSPRKVWLTGIAQLKFDDRSSRSLPYFGGGRNPGLVGLALLQPRRLVVQVLRRQRTLNGLHLLALVQHPDMDGVLGENAVRSPRWQPRYHHRVLVTGHGLHALGRVRN